MTEEHDKLGNMTSWPVMAFGAILVYLIPFIAVLILKQVNPTGLALVARGILHYSASHETNGSVVQNPVNHWGKPSGVA